LPTLLSFLDPWLPLALLATAIAYFIDFRRTDDAVAPLARNLLRVALVLLVIRFAAFVSVYGRPPLASPSEGLGTIALCLALVYGILEQLHGERSAGFPLVAAATLFQVAALFGEPAAPLANELLREPWFGFHAISAICGYTGFAIGAVYAAMFLLLYGSLKRARFGMVWDRMPSLDVLARMSIRAATLGFVFLTVSIVAGTFGWGRLLDHPAWQDPKVVATTVAWVVYAIGLSLYYFRGWRGLRLVSLTLVAFLLMVLSSWVVPYLLGSAHGVSGIR
jgi:HemX protein